MGSGRTERRPCAGTRGKAVEAPEGMKALLLHRLRNRLANGYCEASKCRMSCKYRVWQADKTAQRVMALSWISSQLMERAAQFQAPRSDRSGLHC